MHSLNKDLNARFMVHALQVYPHSNYKKLEYEKFVTIANQSKSSHAFRVVVSCYQFNTHSTLCS